jgi:hypothetical protein
MQHYLLYRTPSSKATEKAARNDMQYSSVSNDNSAVPVAVYNLIIDTAEVHIR